MVDKRPSSAHPRGPQAAYQQNLIGKLSSKHLGSKRNNQPQQKKPSQQRQNSYQLPV